MNIALVGRSAAEYYRWHRAGERFAEARRVRIPREFSLREWEAEQVAQKLHLSLPLHIGVVDDRKAHNTRYCRRHVLHASQQGKCAIAVGSGVFVAAPELVFIQASSQLTYVQLLKYGFEMCGGYCVDPAALWGFQQVEPLTTVGRIAELVARCAGVKGVKRARSCLVALRDGAASPREGKLAARVFAPVLRGGYGFRGGQLNQTIELTEEERTKFGKSHFSCDICWREHGVAIEYDSDLVHTGASRIADDSERRNSLFTKGIRVVAVTNRQYSTVEGTDAAMGATMHLAGMRGNLESTRGKRRRSKLLELLEAKDMAWPWGSDDLEAAA